MPINKNALLRYQILDRCFSDRHRRYEIEDLVDKVNDALLDMYGKTVSLRQIRADIRACLNFSIKHRKCVSSFRENNYF